MVHEHSVRDGMPARHFLQLAIVAQLRESREQLWPELHFDLLETDDVSVELGEAFNDFILPRRPRELGRVGPRIFFGRCKVRREKIPRHERALIHSERPRRRLKGQRVRREL